MDAGCDTARARELLQAFPGIGPVGTDIFFREAQAVWPWLRPYFDEAALKGAERIGLPTDPKRLADLVKDRDAARLASGWCGSAKDKKLADTLGGVVDPTFLPALPGGGRPRARRTMGTRRPGRNLRYTKHRAFRAGAPAGGYGEAQA